MEKATLPQKRDKSLVPLSREHHFGLLFTWKIRQGLKNKADLAVMRDYVQYFWTNILKPHCDEEEWLLAEVLRSNDMVRAQIEEEHRHMAWMVNLICGGERMAPEMFQTLQQDLVSHIRWEERELFPYLQTVLPADELDRVAKLMEEHHEEKVADAFTPEFWTE